MADEASQSAKHYRAIFQTNRAGKGQHDRVLNNIENVLNELGDQYLAVALVAHGEGIDLFLKQTKLPRERLEKLAARGVELLACGVTMKRDQLLPEELYDFVRVISSANVELIKRQIEGWAYIKP
jgi:intracellular sulfur oxidation DsrE/DsrF family protein